MRLGGGIWKNKNLIKSIIKLNILDKNKIKLLSQPFTVNDYFSIATKNPQKINRWLIEQGGQDIYEIFLLNEKIFHYLSDLLIIDLTKVRNKFSNVVNVPLWFFSLGMDQKGREDNKQNRLILEYLEELCQRFLTRLAEDPNLYLSRNQFQSGKITEACQQIGNMITEKLIKPEHTCSDSDINEVKNSCE